MLLIDCELSLEGESKKEEDFIMPTYYKIASTPLFAGAAYGKS
jgi:hypothetical protein